MIFFCKFFFNFRANFKQQDIVLTKRNIFSFSCSCNFNNPKFHVKSIEFVEKFLMYFSILEKNNGQNCLNYSNFYQCPNFQSSQIFSHFPNCKNALIFESHKFKNLWKFMSFLFFSILWNFEVCIHPVCEVQNK